MLVHNEIEVTITGTTQKWFANKGYKIPTYKKQLWANIKGKRIKNGTKIRVKNGTKILVKIKDLPPSSNTNILLTCPICKKEYQTRYSVFLKKHSNNCSTCVKKKIKGDGSHSYWVTQLITNNSQAKCDISGEIDKRFLVLHHLDSRSNGGKNTPKNYVILSANYHLAFHIWNGGMNILCTKQEYYWFKEEENNEFI